MPSKKEEFSFPGQTTGQLLEFAYGTFLELGWTPKYAGPNAIAAYTPRSWNKNEVEIIVQATDGSISVQSNLVNNELADLQGRNQKHINKFIAEFEKVKLSEPQTGWAEEIVKLREQTAIVVQEELKQAAEVDKVMNFSKSNLYITYGLIAINIIVFLLMVINGVNATKPTAYDILNWGGNYLPLTVSGDWWRLISCVFVHIGIIHLLFNMYALYMVGVYLEPMLGKTKFIVAYLSTGVIASVASLIWHDEPVPSAGASGAIFGMYGVFLALLLTKLIPKRIRIALLQNIGIFVVFNIVYGFQASGIDNAAHVGGLISGMIIGFAYYFSLKKEKAIKNNFLAIAIAAITVVFTWFYIDNKKSSITIGEREKTLNQIKQFIGKEGKKFAEKFAEFADIDRKHFTIIEDSTINDAERSKKLIELIPEWNRAEKIVEEMKQLEVGETAKKKIELAEGFVAARKEEITAFTRLVENPGPENSLKLSEAKEKISGIVNRLNELD